MGVATTTVARVFGRATGGGRGTPYSSRAIGGSDVGGARGRGPDDGEPPGARPAQRSATMSDERGGALGRGPGGELPAPLKTPSDPTQATVRR